ncbi:MAG: NUDIX domain-containing protein [Candidatus Pacebacteria bacterium]|nr:NUDIX domain-containing protein [Candidatus Paceibacterota bacterium]MBP9832230.1 NUDIX domain-containing protein [Candidatus Paceibacterota bacterium]
MKQILFLNPENVSKDEAGSYPLREAARAVVSDENGMIALLHVSKENYYKLPGGGLESSEDKFSALQRECLEEIGCEVEIIAEAGSILEYRKIFNIRQISYCYVAKTKGAKGIPDFTQHEKDRGFEIIWLQPEKAKQALSESQATSDEGRLYIVPRDLALLEAALILS